LKDLKAKINKVLENNTLSEKAKKVTLASAENGGVIVEEDLNFVIEEVIKVVEEIKEESYAKILFYHNLKCFWEKKIQEDFVGIFP